MTKNTTLKLVYSALCLALALVLPFLTGQIPQVGQMLSPLHIPALLCGFLCGWPYGLAVGFIAPLMRSMIFTMPPMYPAAIAMAFEMAVYGTIAGLLYKRLPKKIPYIYVSLISAMIGGRIVWGLDRGVHCRRFRGGDPGHYPAHRTDPGHRNGAQKGQTYSE